MPSSSITSMGMIKYTALQPKQSAYFQLPGYLGGYSGGYYGGVGGGAAPSAPAPAPAAPAAPAGPTASASDLQVMMAAIPTAFDGQVITADHHNALREALIAMANRLGLGVISEEITITNAPRFIAMTGGSAWDEDAGIVKKASATTGALRGWMEFDLPDGARIKKMAVFASNDAAGAMRVKLRRQKVTDSTTADLISIDITGTDAAHGVEGDVTLPGLSLGAAAIEETRLVNNREFKYLLVAELDTGVAGKEAKITAVQVVCGK
jgi:hypothetical protein